MVRDVMGEARLDFADLDRVGVTVGPGSFTGLRVGLAFGKGLGLALGRSCVGVGTLEALAFGAEGVTAAAIDAGRGNLYIQVFDTGAALMAPDILSLAGAAARLIEVCGGRELTLVGPGAALLHETAPGVRLIERPAPSPEAVARLAATAALAPATPLYLRPPDALPKAARAAV